MPQSVKELVTLLDLEVIEDNLFRGLQPDTQLQRVFGGQVAAQALVAAARTVQERFAVHSLHSYFLRPGDTKVPIVYDVDTLRDGRSFVTRRVVARQHGRPIYSQTASFQAEEEGLDHQDAMPDVPAPEDCPRLSDLVARRAPEQAGYWEREWSALDIRLAGDSRLSGDLASEEHPARNRLWIRTNGDLPTSLPGEPAAGRLVHSAAFTYASDLTLLAVSLVPHGIEIASPKLMSASLDHAIWFHREFDADQWWLYDQVSPSASGARGFAIGRVFTRDGRLVASVAQEGLIRPIG